MRKRVVPSRLAAPWLTWKEPALPSALVSAGGPWSQGKVSELAAFLTRSVERVLVTKEMRCKALAVKQKTADGLRGVQGRGA